MRALKTALVCVTVTIATGCMSGQQSSLPITKPKGVENYVTGVEAMDAGDKARAVEALRKAVAQNPDLITPRIMLGGVYRKDGDYKNALDQYENLVRLDPYTASNHYYLGLC